MRALPLDVAHELLLTGAELDVARAERLERPATGVPCCGNVNKKAPG
jgi:hypothetical protein